MRAMIIEMVTLTAVMIGLSVAAFVYPQLPRAKPDPSSQEKSIIIEVQAPPAIQAVPMTRQEKVDELDKKLEQAEDDLSEISKIIEMQQAIRAAKELVDD